MQIRQIERFHGWVGLDHSSTSLEGSHIDQNLEGIDEGGREGECDTFGYGEM